MSFTDAPTLYIVRVWVSPQGGERYLHWLETKHMTELIREPGFLWARRIRLEQTDDKGWQSYLLIYGAESQAAVDEYLKSSARERFWKELESLNDVHHAERYWGTADFEVSAKRS